MPDALRAGRGSRRAVVLEDVLVAGQHGAAHVAATIAGADATGPALAVGRAGGARNNTADAHRARVVVVEAEEHDAQEVERAVGRVGGADAAVADQAVAVHVPDVDGLGVGDAAAARGGVVPAGHDRQGVESEEDALGVGAGDGAEHLAGVRPTGAPTRSRRARAGQESAHGSDRLPGDRWRGAGTSARAQHVVLRAAGPATDIVDRARAGTVGKHVPGHKKERVGTLHVDTAQGADAGRPQDDQPEACRCDCGSHANLLGVVSQLRGRPRSKRLDAGRVVEAGVGVRRAAGADGFVEALAADPDAAAGGDLGIGTKPWVVTRFGGVVLPECMMFSSLKHLAQASSAPVTCSKPISVLTYSLSDSG